MLRIYRCEIVVDSGSHANNANAVSPGLCLLTLNVSSHESLLFSNPIKL